MKIEYQTSLYPCPYCDNVEDNYHVLKRHIKEKHRVINASLMDYAKLRCLTFLNYNCYSCGSHNLALRDGCRVVCLTCGRDWYETRKNERIQQVYNCLKDGGNLE